ncbi:hypothetical protein [Pararcticibacter amylolyticus]|nr:hypothetical protein [Pararcticibacter amylolyticus]
MKTIVTGSLGGRTLENFHRAGPTMGKRKLVDFAKEFAAVYYKTQ